MKSTHSKPYEKLIAVLTKERKKRRVSQVDLAGMLGKPQSYISKYEGRERRLDISEFVLICRALGANPAVVLCAADLISKAEIQEAQETS